MAPGGQKRGCVVDAGTDTDVTRWADMNRGREG